MKTTAILPLLTLALSATFLISCGEKKSSSSGSDSASSEATATTQPGGTEGATAILNEILNNPEKATELSQALRPTTADYAAVFSDADFAKKAESTYNGAWDGGAIVVQPNPGQSELKLFSATSEDLKAWNEKAKEFPGGYKRIVGEFKPGLTIYCFKTLKPGEKYGMSYNGLIHVNGHWRLFPKPWRIER